ncbi:MAG: hypothetical protein O3A00_19990 [Planctomycetota bacterium]|nr:hypothetical protein [Planctomycetota bacterium]
MSAIDLPRAVDWAERTGDRLNPILVKETRQSLKSRQFVISFMLLLVAAWLVSSLGMLLAGNRVQYGSIAMVFFVGYFCVLDFAVLVIVPYSAFRSLLSETEQNTFDLLSITTLTPSQIVSGKLSSAITQVFIYFSAIAPFVAFTSLLQGFDLPNVIFLLGVIFILSMGTSMLALMLATFARQKQWQVLTSLFLLGGLVWISIGMMAAAVEMQTENIPFDNVEFWAIGGIILTGFLSYFVLAQQIATSQLTFEAGNRSTGIRVVMLAQFILFWAIAFGFAYFRPRWVDMEALTILTVIATFHLTAVGLFMGTEGDYISRRLRRDLPESRVIRLLISPLLPGGSRGYLYFVTQVIVMWWVVCVGAPAWGLPGKSIHIPTYVGNVFALNVREWPTPLIYATGCACYLLIYLGIGNWLSRWCMSISPMIRPVHTRVFTILITVSGVMLPAILRVTEFVKPNSPPSILELPSPYMMASFRMGNANYNVHMLLLMIAAAFFTAVNVRAMYRGVDTIVNSDIVSNSRPGTLGRES